MTAKEMIELLNQYPQNVPMNIFLDGETNELIIKEAWCAYIPSENVLLLNMTIRNPE